MKKLMLTYAGILLFCACLFTKSVIAHNDSNKTVYEFLKAEVINYQKLVIATHVVKYNDISKEQMICANHINSQFFNDTNKNAIRIFKFLSTDTIHQIQDYLATEHGKKHFDIAKNTNLLKDDDLSGQMKYAKDIYKIRKIVNQTHPLVFYYVIGISSYHIPFDDIKKNCSIRYISNEVY